MCLRLNNNQYTQLNKIADSIVNARKNDNVIRADEIDDISNKITSFFQDKNNGNIGTNDVEAIKNYVKNLVQQKYGTSNIDTVDTTVSKLITQGFDLLGKAAKSAGDQEQAKIKSNEGKLGAIDRSMSKEDSDDWGITRFSKAAYRKVRNAVTNDDVNNLGNNQSQQQAIQNRINATRSNFKQEILRTEQESFQKSVRTHCFGDALEKLGYKNDLAPTEKIDTNKLKKETGKDWTGINVNKEGGEFTPAQKKLLQASGGKILVESGKHVMVGTYDPKTGKVYAEGKEITKGSNVFIQGKVNGVVSSDKSIDKMAHNFSDFSKYQSDLDPHYKTENQDQRSMKKLGVLFADKAPSSRKALSDIAQAAMDKDINKFRDLLAKNGIELSPAMLRNIMDTMSAKISPPKELKDQNGKVIGTASNVFEAFQLLQKAPGAINNVLGGLEQTDPKRTMDKFLLADGGRLQDNANEMIKQIQALIKGEDGC
ncbi:MAG: hypothetical protein U0457_17445 [Candidatus Sericytochromatia bacterium]